jgi:hypothetical protein
MRSAYKFLAYTISVLVVVQAGAIAWGFFGLSKWIENDGGVVDKSYLEAEGQDMAFTAEWGFAIHMFFVGFALFQLVALLFLITSFFAKVPGGVGMAAGLVGLVILQVWVLPLLSSEVGSGFGALHGINALLILGLSLMAGKRAALERTTPTSSTTVPA